MSIRIVTDSDCDLPQERVDRHGITVLPMHTNIGTQGILDGVTTARQEFHGGLAQFGTQPMTLVPGPGKWIEAFDRLAADGATGILAVHVAGSLSAMVNTARLAAEEGDKKRTWTRGAALARVIDLRREVGPLEPLVMVRTHDPRERRRWSSGLNPCRPGAAGFVAIRSPSQLRAHQ